MPIKHDCVQREGLKEWEELGFEFRKQRFVYVEEKNAFEKLPFPTKVRAKLQLLCLCSALAVGPKLFLQCA